MRSDADGPFLIGDQTWSEAIALTADGVFDDWDEVPIAGLSKASLGPLLQLQPELIVVGTGSRQVLPDRELMFAMPRAGVGLELVDTPAAARTFNVLVSEDRDVAAVLIID